MLVLHTIQEHIITVLAVPKQYQFLLECQYRIRCKLFYILAVWIGLEYSVASFNK